MRREGALRVFFVGDFSASKGGNYSVAEELARRLALEGFDVRTTSARVGRARRVLDMISTAYRQRSEVDVAVIDVFSGMAFRWAEWVTKVLRGAGVPLVHVLRGGNLPKFARAHPERVERVLGGSTRVVALSAYLAEALAPYARSCQVVPNPIEVRDYPFRPREGAAPGLVWLRSFHAIYNPTLAPKVLAELRDVEGLHLTMTGADKGDGTRERTLAEARALGVADRLTVAPPVSKAGVPARLNEGDVFLNTTDVDNVPISVLEAMACGLCVISTAVGGIPYLLEDGVDALLVPPNDAPAMAAAVRRVLADPELAAHLSRNGREKAASFDWSHVVPTWRVLLQEVAEVQS
ncbi:MAG: glycosyltransferase family 4 protein [Trueperaceae bacterium]